MSPKFATADLVSDQELKTSPNNYSQSKELLSRENGEKSSVALPIDAFDQENSQSQLIDGKRETTPERKGKNVRRRIIKRLTNAIGEEKIQELLDKGKLPEISQPEKFNKFNRSGKKAGTFVNKMGQFLINKRLEGKSSEMTRDNALEIANRPQFYTLKNSPNLFSLV